MIEKLRLHDEDVWIVIEPHLGHFDSKAPHEYFTASYHMAEPMDHPQGILFTDDSQAPCLFDSPVQALAYAQQTLLQRDNH